MGVLERVRQQVGDLADEAREDAAEQRRLSERLKRGLVERLGLTQIASLVSAGAVDQVREELAVVCRAVLCSGGFEELGEDERDALMVRVIDEIVGQQFALFFVPPKILYIALGFLAFRLFDIVKPPPARFCQDHLPGGWGVVMDDVMAGVWTNILLLLAIKLAGI